LNEPPRPGVTSGRSPLAAVRRADVRRETSSVTCPKPSVAVSPSSADAGEPFVGSGSSPLASRSTFIRRLAESLPMFFSCSKPPSSVVAVVGALGVAALSESSASPASGRLVPYLNEPPRPGVTSGRSPLAAVRRADVRRETSSVTCPKPSVAVSPSSVEWLPPFESSNDMACLSAVCCCRLSSSSFSSSSSCSSLSLSSSSSFSNFSCSAFCTISSFSRNNLSSSSFSNLSASSCCRLSSSSFSSSSSCSSLSLSSSSSFSNVSC